MYTPSQNCSLESYETYIMSSQRYHHSWSFFTLIIKDGSPCLVWCKLGRWFGWSSLPSWIFHFLGGNLISWASHKLTIVVCSSTEVKYRAIAFATTELVWLCQVIWELGLLLFKTPTLLLNSISAMHLYEFQPCLPSTVHAHQNRLPLCSRKSWAGRAFSAPHSYRWSNCWYTYQSTWHSSVYSSAWQASHVSLSTLSLRGRIRG